MFKQKRVGLAILGAVAVWAYAPLFYLLIAPAFFVMERKMLLGIKQRAERVRRQRKVSNDFTEAQS
jgi:hypothetical protein